MTYSLKHAARPATRNCFPCIDHGLISKLFSEKADKSTHEQGRFLTFMDRNVKARCYVADTRCLRCRHPVSTPGVDTKKRPRYLIRSNAYRYRGRGAQGRPMEATTEVRGR